MSVEIPSGATHTHTSATFDQDTAPERLQSSHQLSEGFWGRLVVYSGALGFRFVDEPDAGLEVTAGESVTIPPVRPHYVVLDGPVTFAIEFHRVSGPAHPTQ